MVFRKTNILSEKIKDFCQNLRELIFSAALLTRGLIGYTVIERSGVDGCTVGHIIQNIINEAGQHAQFKNFELSSGVCVGWSRALLNQFFFSNQIEILAAARGPLGPKLFVSVNAAAKLY